MLKTEFAGRRARLGSELRERGLDAMLVSAPANIRYLAGFTGSNALLVLIRSSATLFTDPRYGIQARQECDCPVRVATVPLFHAAATLLKSKQARTVGFESSRMVYDAFASLRDRLDKRQQLRPLTGLVEKLRMVKSAAEIEKIERSVTVNSKAFQQALRSFQVGMKELELAAEIDYRMRRLGADGAAFETIVASGPRSALPHARPTGEAIRNNTLLLVDMGAQYGGYTSDMTRVVAIGKQGKSVHKMYRAVLEAQLAAIDAVRPGASAAQVDAAARNVLRKHGLDRFFVHSTGHGLGLEIHEAPRLARSEKTALEAGMVITIEPGVYLEGSVGIRIEDTVAVTENGARILTPTTKELVCL